MERKYTPSIVIAIYTSLGLTVIYGIIRALGAGLGEDGIYELIIFFILSLILFTVVLEFFVYNKLKSLTSVKEEEIQKLKEMEAFRREFLGNVSHELKTPIFAIQGFLETLLEGALEDEEVNRKFLQKALKHSDRLASLVQDLLVITQVESGDMEMHMANFRIYDLIRDVVDSLEHKFTKKGRNVTCNIEAGKLKKAVVLADKERIRQVILNLIDNAVKYGDQQGRIDISLSRNDDKILVHVKDNGQGIEAEHLPRLFERFYRVDKSRSRERGGTGLGLAICKHLIEAHDERITVKSKIGEGTTFTFSLQEKA